MVVRIADLPTPWTAIPAFALGIAQEYADPEARQLLPMGPLLLARASSLAGITVGGRGIQGISGTPLHLTATECRNTHDCLISNRVLMVVDVDGSMCLRLPREIAEDLIDNGLCIRAGKNLLTWPPANEHQLEIAWRILLHAYWHATSTRPERMRRMWSEWVINH